ncbi:MULTISPECIES: hypothetical protein [Streptomyces]|uniref:hypothetical protein n=1 Tax=Streptomyces TaxID=1883 RepID=UPI000D457696|nr:MULTISPECIES: hypothetical protein [Streptomyces]PPS69383.1 hypothetical protein BV882_27645 [Streptomyces sp. 46]
MWNQARSAFLRRLAADARRPGFELLIAETTGLTGCAYGFPAGGDGPWWEGFDGYLPGRLLRLAASGRLFVISGIHVPSRVRRQNQDRAWNLARRLQRRLLTDHGAAVAVTLVTAPTTGTSRRCGPGGGGISKATHLGRPRSARSASLVLET